MTDENDMQLRVAALSAAIILIVGIMGAGTISFITVVEPVACQGEDSSNWSRSYGVNVTCTLAFIIMGIVLFAGLGVLLADYAYRRLRGKDD